MAQFLRPTEARLIAVMDVGDGDLLDQLCVRSGLAPTEARTAMGALERRGLAVRGREGRYALSARGVTVRRDSLADGESRISYAPVFLLDDEVEEAASSASQEELDLALDRELGPRDQNSGE
jgi:DNA-binding IclR family transcriptional regulator